MHTINTIIVKRGHKKGIRSVEVFIAEVEICHYSDRIFIIVECRTRNYLTKVQLVNDMLVRHYFDDKLITGFHSKLYT